MHPRSFRRSLQPLSRDAEFVSERKQFVDVIRPHMAHDHATIRVSCIVDVNSHAPGPVTEIEHSSNMRRAAENSSSGIEVVPVPTCTAVMPA